MSRCTKYRKVKQEVRNILNEVHAEALLKLSQRDRDTVGEDVGLTHEQQHFNEFLPFPNMFRPVSGLDVVPVTPEGLQVNGVSVISGSSHDTECNPPNLTDSLEKGNSFIPPVLKGSDFQDALAEWKASCNIPRSSMDKLLHILHAAGHVDLPKDSRTLLKTRRTSSVRSLGAGKFYYFGLQENLQFRLQGWKDLDECAVVVNIDGLSLFNSSSIQFWPILCRIVADVNTFPFLVALYCGEGKPEPLADYLHDFIQEVKILTRQGVTLNSFGIDQIQIPFRISAFICDAPARAFVKCIKGHSGYSSCERCTQEGEYYEHRITFPDVNFTLRTDEAFVKQSDEDHHNGVSPLLELNFEMVTAFPLDAMHDILRSSSFTFVSMGWGRRFFNC